MGTLPTCPTCGISSIDVVSHWCQRPVADDRHPLVTGFVLLTWICPTDPAAQDDCHCRVMSGYFPARITPRRGISQILSREYFEGLEEMKRYNSDNQKKAGKFVLSKDHFLKDRPNLDAMLNDAFWDDGKPRETCSLTVRTGTDRAMVSLNDSDLEQSISTNGENVQDALDRLEAYLTGGNPTWRPWGRKKGR